MHSETEQRAYRLGWLRATNPNGWDEQDDITSGDAIFDSQMFDDLDSDYPTDTAPTPDAAASEAGEVRYQGCNRPPDGWWCCSEPGHDGPCPTRRIGER